MTQVIEGAQAWSAEGRRDVGVLVLHGLTGNPVSLRPLAESLAGDGYHVELPRLPGHGTRWQDLARTTWRDWAREANAALELLRARTSAQVAVGLSMGGTLSLHLAITRPDDLAGIVLINPTVKLRDPRRKALPALKWVVPGLPGIGNDIAKPGGDEKPYPKMPLKALSSLVDLQRRVRARLGEVGLPMLVLTSRQDHVVDVADSRLVMDRVTSDEREQVWLERSYHVATLDHDAAEIEQRVAAFIEKVTT